MSNIDKRTPEERELVRRMATTDPNLPFSDFDFQIHRSKDAEGAFGCSYETIKGKDTYYAVIANTTTGYVDLVFRLKGLEKFKRPHNPQDEEPQETEIERALRKEARTFLNLFFSSRKSITTSKKKLSTLSIDFHFLRDDDNFPTAQEFKIAKLKLEERLQKIVDLWLQQDNPQKPA